MTETSRSKSSPSATVPCTRGPGWEVPAATGTSIQDAPLAPVCNRDNGEVDRGTGQQNQKDVPTQDLDELAEMQAYKSAMLDDAASATSVYKRGTAKGKAAQLRLLETKLSRAAVERNLVKRLSLSAEERQQAEEDKAADLDKRSKAADNALATLETWMDNQPLSRTAQPEDKQNQLAKLIRQAEVARAAALAQRAAAQRERDVCLHAKREADRAEREYHASTEIREELSRQQMEQEASRMAEAMGKASIEVAVAAKMEAHHRTRAADREQARRDLREKADAQMKATKAAHLAAADRANLLVRDAEPALKEVAHMKQEAHDQRVEAVLQLKADTEAAAAFVRGRNERRAEARAKEDAEHEAEREQLAAKGLNPYQVFKRRDVVSRAVKEKKRQENAIRARKEEIADVLQKEALLRQKKDYHERIEREHEQRFRNELGKHVTDARNREYLRSRTVDGTDVLDPSGRSFRVEPSQVTTIKDAAFGLGYHPRKHPEMASAVVDLVASKPRHAGVGTGEFAPLVPRDPIRAGANNMVNCPNNTNTPSAVKTTRARTEEGGTSHLLDEFVPSAKKESLPRTGAESEEGDSSAPGNDHESGGDVGRDTERVGGGGSLFEKRALEKARLRQKDRLDAGEPQVAAGRTFRDRPAFVSKPDCVNFKDFVVGKLHRKRVILTNVSLTFNTLKVLDMPDEIIRFFEVSYSKPGRLSAGMTCAVDIAFTPKVDEDIFTELPIRTQTGPLSIPVVCTARRVQPSLSTNLVVFRRTVIGERETARVLVTNDGAIPTTFTIEDAENKATQSRPQGPDVPSRPFTTDPAISSVAGDDSSNSVLTHGEAASGDKRRKIRTAESASSAPALVDNVHGHTHHEMLPTAQRSGGSQEAKSRAGNSFPTKAASASLPATEEELLARAAAVGDAVLQHPKGRTAIDVEAGGEEGLGGRRGEGGGSIAAYGSSEIVVTFSPLTVGNFCAVKVIRFEGCQEHFELVIEASSAPVAVFPAEASIDLRCCVLGKLYIKKIRICNRGKIAMKAVAHLPSSLRECASFSPDMGFVQPGSHFDFGLRFRPDEKCLARCIRDGWGTRLPQDRDISETLRPTRDSPHEPTADPAEGANRVAKDAEAEEEMSGGMIAVPVRFDVPGQQLPARFILLAMVTGWRVDVQCGDECIGTHAKRSTGKGSSGGGRRCLWFGPCFVGQSVTKRVSLRNTSQLPVKFGFVGNPTEVAVQPFDGFGVLLPGEQRWLEAIFSPGSAVSHNSHLTFRTSVGQTTSIRCQGRGVEPVVNLSHTVLTIAPACPGDTITTGVFAQNISAIEQAEAIANTADPPNAPLPRSAGLRLNFTLVFLRAQQLEFVAPEPALSFLRICPSVVCLGPGRGARIEIQFCPPPVSPSSDVQLLLQADRNLPEESDDAHGFTHRTATAPDSNADCANPDEYAVSKAVESESQVREHNEVRGPDARAFSDVPLHAGLVEEAGLVHASQALVTHGASVTADPGANLGVDDGEWGRLEAEPWSRHGRWRVPCFLKHTKDTEAVFGGGEDSELPPLALAVTTVTVGRVLSVDKTRVEFGQLAVGSKAETSLRFRNASDDDLPLEGQGLNAVGPFEVVNAFRPLRAHGGTHRCQLQFRPERAGIVTENLVVTSPAVGKSVRIRIRGEGVSPVLRMEPADGRLEMGYTLEGDTVERNVILHNDSVFPMLYTTEAFGPRPPDNYNHMEIFALTPCQGRLSPGESVTVKATFSPDHCRMWPFLAAFRIQARDQVYVVTVPPGLNPGDQVAEATEDILAPHPSDGGASAAPIGEAVAAGWQLAATAVPPIVLRFPKENIAASDAGGGISATPKTMTLLVGCLNTNDPKKSSAGSFEVELSAEAKSTAYFKATPDRGVVAPGSAAEVACSFEPPPPPPRTPGPAGCKGGTPEVGQWYKVAAMVHVRGGYRPPGSSEVLTVHVQLEGFVTV